MRSGGGRDASHGDTWQSRSAETHGDVAVLTPTHQTVQETSPGWHKVKLRAGLGENCSGCPHTNRNHVGIER